MVCQKRISFIPCEVLVLTIELREGNAASTFHCPELGSAGAMSLRAADDAKGTLIEPLSHITINGIIGKYGPPQSCKRKTRGGSLSPIAGAGIMDRDPPCQQLHQQLRHGWCNLTITRGDDGPFKVSPELSRANAPSLQGDRRRLPNLYEGPVPAKSQCRLSIRKRTAHNEVIVPKHQNADHAV